MHTLTKTFLGLCFVFAGSAATASIFQFAEHTPGYGMFADGTRFYNSGFHFTARNHFLNAAYWADKMAQHNVGAMYYRGEGVETDHARAWAWLELSAERGYPEFVTVAEKVWGELDIDERRRAHDILAELMPIYGDEAAIPRTAVRMERDRVRGARLRLSATTVIQDGSGTRSRKDYFAKERWDIERVIEREKQVFEALANTNVSLGAFELVDDDQPSREGEAGKRNGSESPRNEPAP